MMHYVVATVLVASVFLSPRGVAGQGRCCFWPETSDRCDACSSFADSSNYCAGGQTECETDCGHVWCPDATVDDDDDSDDASPSDDYDDDGEWVRGTYTTGYWDCCKPSCAWPGKGNVDQPVRACAAETGDTLTDANAVSVCDGGVSAACADHQPFDVSAIFNGTRLNVSMGFAAAAVGGVSGLDGDTNCGQCFELRFTDDEFSWGGGAHADIVGNSHVVQVTNIGYDVSGDHSFDLQIPGAGQGIFTTGCPLQFPGFLSGDFDCDNNYGGCDDVSGCDRLPEVLRDGCRWRYGPSYRWLHEGGRSNNPFVRFRRVKCPAQLVALTGTTPLDDDAFPEFFAEVSVAEPTATPAPSAAAGNDDVVVVVVEDKTTRKKKSLDKAQLGVAVAVSFVGGLLCAFLALAFYNMRFGGNRASSDADTTEAASDDKKNGLPPSREPEGDLDGV